MVLINFPLMLVPFAVYNFFILAGDLNPWEDVILRLDMVSGASFTLSMGDVLIVIKSTVPPGTTRDVLAPILASSGLRPGRDVHVAHCPERVLPGARCRHLDRRQGGGVRAAAHPEQPPAAVLGRTKHARVVGEPLGGVEQVIGAQLR